VPLADLYRTARITIHQAGRGRALIFSEEHGHALEVDASVARLLSLCQGCKTLDGHAAALARAGMAGDAHAVVATLQSLAMTGLLRSCADLLPTRDARTAPVEAKPITTIAVITADRPQILRRGLESFARHLDAHGQPARLLVVDGSRDEGAQAANQRVTAELARSSRRTIDYVGPVEAAALQERLAAAAGAPRETLDFALTPGAIGANRNLVLLFTAGEHVLMADDDIVCEPWTRNGRAGGVALWGHSEPQDSEFFPTRDDARHAVTPRSGDVVATHAAVLGRRLPDLLSASGEAPDLGEGCSHLIGALVDRRAPALRLTFTGIAGDSGTYCPYTRLFVSGPTQARLASSREVFERALRSREVVRAVSRTTLTHDSRCMAGCMGLANTSLLPPFMPAGRNEDGVFGAMLTALDPLALFAHLPIGVVHDSGRPPVYEDRSMRSASESRVSDLLMLLARTAVQGALDADPSARLARLAGALADLAAFAPSSFSQYATRVLLDARAQQLARIEMMVGRPAEYPPYWRAALEEYRRTITRSLARPDFFLPIEFQGAGGVEAGFERLRRCVGQFAGVLQVWPELVGSAAGP
jgi:hypothetical protein